MLPNDSSDFPSPDKLLMWSSIVPFNVAAQSTLTSLILYNLSIMCNVLNLYR